MADGTQEDRLVFPKLLDGAVGQHLARFQIAIAAEVVVVPVEFKSKLLAGGFANLEGFPRDFRSSAVAADDCDVIAFHGLRSVCVGRRKAMLRIRGRVAMEFSVVALSQSLCIQSGGLTEISRG